jgi:hypothetical protein
MPGDFEMPNRIIREAILSSEKVALLGWPEEVFYRRLHSIVDDYGRYEANPQLLRSRCYPLQTDAVRVTDISRWMAACQTAGLILNYAVQGKQYLEVINFGQQQRSASKYPSPPAVDSACNHLLADAHLVVSVSGVVSEGGGGKRASRIPDDFNPKPEPEAEQGIDRAKELANFRDYWTSKARDNTKLDWQATWRTWARKSDRVGVSKFPDKNAIPAASTIWHESAAGITAKAVELELPRRDEVLETFPAFKSRVLAAVNSLVEA